jgi:hypothetical protein
LQQQTEENKGLPVESSQSKGEVVEN